MKKVESLTTYEHELYLSDLGEWLNGKEINVADQCILLVNYMALTIHIAAITQSTIQYDSAIANKCIETFIEDLKLKVNSLRKRKMV